MNTIREVLDGMEVIRFGHLQEQRRVRHAISTRRQWRDGRLEEANLSLCQGPGRQEGRANRLRLCRALGLDAQRLTWAGQVHGRTVRPVGPQGGGKVEGADGLVTDATGVPLLGFSADCPLIALVDPRRPAVGVVHASWRGTVQRIVQVAVARMSERFGTRPDSILAGIGPSAGPQRYEVGPDVVEAVQEHLGGVDHIIRRNGRTYLDLWSANQAQLLECGVCAQNIRIAGLCTIERGDSFYSYRREGRNSGRFGLMIGLAQER